MGCCIASTDVLGPDGMGEVERSTNALAAARWTPVQALASLIPVESNCGLRAEALELG
jgi:hypothetical protein